MGSRGCISRMVVLSARSCSISFECANASVKAVPYTGTSTSSSKIGQAADVVFVAVCQQNGTDAFAIGAHITEVGNDDVHAEQFSIRKHDATVDDNDVIVKLKRHHVHAKFAEAAERNDF